MKQATLNAKKQNKVVSTAAKNATVEAISKEKTAIKIEQALSEIAKEKESEVIAEEITEEKKDAKKATAKKVTTTKTEVKKEVEAEKNVAKPQIFVQFYNNEINMDAIIEKVNKAYVAEGNEAKEDDQYRIYVKPEENMVYYVVNDSYASGVVLY